MEYTQNRFCLFIYLFSYLFNFFQIFSNGWVPAILENFLLTWTYNPRIYTNTKYVVVNHKNKGFLLNMYNTDTMIINSFFYLQFGFH